MRFKKGVRFLFQKSFMLQFDDEEKGEMKAKKKKRCNYVSIEAISPML
jgi:hypothetical protein